MILINIQKYFSPTQKSHFLILVIFCFNIDENFHKDWNFDEIFSMTKTCFFFFLVTATAIMNIYTDRLLNYFTFYHPFTSLSCFWNKKWCLTTSSSGWVPFFTSFSLCANNVVFPIFSLNYVFTFIGIYKHTKFFLSSTNTNSKTLFLSERCVLGCSSTSLASFDYEYSKFPSKSLAMSHDLLNNIHVKL